MSSTSKRSPSSIATCCVRGSCAKRTISSAVSWRGLIVMSIAGLLEHLHRDGVVDDRDREARAVHLGERRGVVVLHVVAHREHRRPGRRRCARARGSPGRSRSRGRRARPAARSATIRARARATASMIRTPMPCSSRSRATAVPTRPAPKMTTSRDLAAYRARSARSTPAPPAASRSRPCGRRAGSRRCRAGARSRRRG